MLDIDQDITLTGQQPADDGDGILLLEGETPDDETVYIDAENDRMHFVDKID